MKLPDPVEFRLALSRYPTGVTVITAASGGGRMCGMTANSFTSVSLEPPTILVSLMQGRTRRAIQRTGRFVVNVLGEDADGVSAHFAGKPARNHVPPFSMAGDYPTLKDAIAGFNCRVVEEHNVHDHTLIIAEVESCHAEDSDPLIFFGSKYRQLLA